MIVVPFLFNFYFRRKGQPLLLLCDVIGITFVLHLEYTIKHNRNYGKYAFFYLTGLVSHRVGPDIAKRYIRSDIEESYFIPPISDDRIAA